MAARRAALRARLAEARGDRPRRRARRRWLVALLLLLLALLLLRRCDCEAPPTSMDAGLVEPGFHPVDAGPQVAPPPPRAPRQRRPPPRVKPSVRPEYRPAAPGPRPWLPALRLQVAARAPRLAKCFEGLAQPGALEWTATVDPRSGVVSDQAFEEALSGAPLSRDLRRCLEAVLSSPRYALRAGDGPPTRLTVLVEF